MVSEAEAPPHVRAIFAEVRHHLGVPVVPMLYQAYAAVPRFLELHWQAFQPVLQTRQFFLMGERLAAETYTRAQSYFDIPDLNLGDGHFPANGDSAGEICSIARTLEYYQYLDPLLLLITVAQMQAFDGTIGRQASNIEVGDREPFATAPELVPVDRASSALRRLWEERRQTLELAFVPDEHRAVAMWPDLYQQHCAALKKLASPLYADCQFRIGESAWRLVRDLPVQVETEIPRLVEAGIADEEICLLARINESLIEALTGLLLDVTVLRIACEGGSRAESPVPLGPKSEAQERHPREFEVA